MVEPLESKSFVKSLEFPIEMVRGRFQTAVCLANTINCMISELNYSSHLGLD